MLFFVCFTNICFKVYFVCYQYNHSYCFLGTVYMVSLFPFFYFKLICAFESKIILLKIMCSWAIPFFFVNLTSLCLYWRVQSIHIQCIYSSGRIYMCILLSVFPMSYVLLFFCFYITAFICFKSIFSTVPFQFPVVSFAIYFGVFFLVHSMEITINILIDENLVQIYMNLLLSIEYKSFASLIAL